MSSREVPRCGLKISTTILVSVVLAAACGSPGLTSVATGDGPAESARAAESREVESVCQDIAGDYGSTATLLRSEAATAGEFALAMEYASDSQDSNAGQLGDIGASMLLGRQLELVDNLVICVVRDENLPVPGPPPEPGEPPRVYDRAIVMVHEGELFPVRFLREGTDYLLPSDIAANDLRATEIREAIALRHSELRQPLDE